jgi:hypothetical protein
MEELICEACGAKFGSRHDLAAHDQKEHSHQPSDGVIAGQPPKIEER